MRFTYQTGAQPLDGYTIQRGIHRGGFGEVYFARSHGGKDVALKLLHHQDQDVEIRGVTQCLNLKHPNLINLHDLRSDQHGDYWVVMEYVAGSSLEDVLTSFPDGLPLNEIRDWMKGLIAGVAFLHDRGIVHRDLKPANIYREAGIVKVGDVGLSKRLNSEHRQHTQSVGTVYYMAPEVAKGQYGPEVDVYSLGVILYEMVSGRLPFSGETMAEILMKHLTAQPDLTPIPKPLRATIARALEKDPAKRTPDVRKLGNEIRDALETCMAGADSPSCPDPPPFGTRTFSRDGESEFRPRRRCRSAFSSSDLKRTVRRVVTTTAPIAIALPLTFVLILVLIRTFRSSAYPSWMMIVAAVVGGLTIRRVLSISLASKGRTEPLRTESASPKNSLQTDSATERWADIGPSLANSLGVSAIVSSGMIALISAWINSGSVRSPLLPSIEHTAMCAATAIVGCWLILLGHAWTLTSRAAQRRASLIRLLAGVLVGSCAYGLGRFLVVDLPTNAYMGEAVVSAIGQRPLVEVTNPTWAGYSLFFALWMGLNSWSRDLYANRKYRVHLVSILLAIGSAYLIASIYAFPQRYAMLWALTISTSVQLAAFRNSRTARLATR